MPDTSKAEEFEKALKKNWSDYREAQNALLDRDRPVYETALSFVSGLIPAINTVTGKDLVATASQIRVDLKLDQTSISIDLKERDLDETKPHGYRSFNLAIRGGTVHFENRQIAVGDSGVIEDAIIGYLLKQFSPTEPGAYTPIREQFPLRP